MRTLTFGITLTLLCLRSCLSSPVPGRQESANPKPDADESSIYSVIVETQFNQKGVRRIVIEKDRTVPGVLAAPIIDRQQRFERDIQKRIPEARADTIADFAVKATRPDQFKHPLDIKVPSVFLTREEIDDFFSVARYGWTNFYKAYPGAQGILNLSHAGFNSNRSEALVYFGNTTDYEGGAGYFVLLRKKNSSWIIVKQSMVWVS